MGRLLGDGRTVGPSKWVCGLKGSGSNGGQTLGWRPSCSLWLGAEGPGEGTVPMGPEEPGSRPLDRPPQVPSA